ncbi:MAG: hypothetical protein JNG90_13980, partial [Planctomycetaceae bacterium]|nr:hypothetical protein [Planctomycetaceae bacterium]
AGHEPRRFVIPPGVRHLAWNLFADTAANSPDDIFPGLDGPAPPADGAVLLHSRSLVCYVAPPTHAAKSDKS